MDERKRIKSLEERLRELYPDAGCSLNYRNAYELLVATVLSAQCTDDRVNQVTPALFRACATPEALAALPSQDLEALIRSTGFFRNKAKSLLSACKVISERHGGRVPETMEDLVALPGVARKTANVALGNAFGKAEGFVVDTHVRRLSGRMALSQAKEPEKIEQDLMRLFPRQSWIELGHRLILHGRRVCTAKGPACGKCGLSDCCPKVGVEGAKP